jgi:uncharacterized membrane protein
MPQNAFGLPVHILVVHVVVVLLPIAVVAAIIVAAWPRVRARWGMAVLGLTFVATLFVPVATQSGESLQARLPSSPIIRAHASLGKDLIPIAALFGICVFVLVAIDLHRRATADPKTVRGLGARVFGKLPAKWRATGERGWHRLGLVLASVLTVVFAVAVGYLVVRAGHTGARAVWDHTIRLKQSVATP